jgi:phage replication O-like protein O
MTSSQKEDGYIQIPIRLWDAYCRFRIPGEVRQVIDTVIRKTDGWHKQQDAISLSQFVAMTGLVKPHVVRAKNLAIEHKIITKNGNGSLSLNKDPQQWVPFARIVTKKGNVTEKGNTEASVTEKGNGKQLPKRVTEITEKGNKSLPKRVPTKDTLKDTTKDNSPAGTSQKQPKLSSHPFIARMQKALGYPEKLKTDPIPNPAKEAKFIKKMQTRGFSYEEIFNAWQLKVNQRGYFVSMVYVNDDIGGHDAKTRFPGSQREYTEPPGDDD